MKLGVCTTEELSETVPVKLTCMLVVLIRVLTFNGHCHAGKMCFSRFKLYWADGRRFADVNVVNRMPYGGGGVMVWATNNENNCVLLMAI
jgi:hypothetical protein